jgi:Ca2+-binding RTX toxin-like protein
MSKHNRKLGAGPELLEQRQLMAADIDFDSRTGVLTITGDEFADTAYVRFEGSEVDVRLESQRANGSVQTLRRDERIRDVREIKFNGLGGNDKLFVSQDAAASAVDLQRIYLTYNAGGGHDSMDNNSSVRSTAYGGTGNDTLIGGSSVDYLYGQDDRDTISGRAGNDHLYGGNHADTIHGDLGNDHLFGESGADYLYGGGGQDRIRGGDHDDWIWGDLYANPFYGQADVLIGDGGIDRIYGGGGNDEISGDHYAPGATDYLFGEAGDDLLYGGDGDDFLYGGDGNDRIEGGRGTDHLYGDNYGDYFAGGDDWLMGGDGKDYLYGGGGNDFLQGGQRRTDSQGNVLKNADYDGASDELYGQDGRDTFEKDESGRWTWKFWKFFWETYNRDPARDRSSNEQVVNWY